MVSLKIDTNDMVAIKEIQEIIRQKFNFDVEITSEPIDIDKKTKWAEFAEKMDGLFTSDIIEHIETSRKEARKELNNLLYPSKNNIKITNSNSSKKLEKALNFLNEYFKDNGEIPFEKAREEYLTNKYNV